MRAALASLALLAMVGCDQSQAVIQPVLAPTPTPAPVPDMIVPSPSPAAPSMPVPIPDSTPPIAEAEKPALATPLAPAMGTRGLALIVEYEGYAARPEAPDARFSGISGGLGYDWSTVAPKVSVVDWQALPAPAPKRLADTHPWTGRMAQANLHVVKDISLPRPVGYDVFNRIDVPRFYAICKRVYPGFEELRPNARDAILSLVYNRGSSFIGDNRREMRELVPLIKVKDYAGMAANLRRSKRVWKGTSIQNGMYNRREGEARLIEIP